jgi:hypothetical protein
MHFLFLNVWRVLVAANSWVKRMGYDPNDIETTMKIAERQKKCPALYFMSLVAMVLAAFVLGN